MDAANEVRRATCEKGVSAPTTGRRVGTNYLLFLESESGGTSVKCFSSCEGAEKELWTVLLHMGVWRGESWKPFFSLKKLDQLIQESRCGPLDLRRHKCSMWIAKAPVHG